MSQYHDTVREDLAEILSTLEQHYRATNPNAVLLFRSTVTYPTAQDTELVRTLTVPQLAQETSHLGYSGHPNQTYVAYTHNFQTGNTDVGQIVTSPRPGLIGVEIHDNLANPQTAPCRFKMSVGFGGRVCDYQVQGSDGMFRPMFQKSMVIDLLKQYLTRK